MPWQTTAVEPANGLKTLPEVPVITAAPAAFTSNSQIRWVRLAVFALLGLYATMAWTASLTKGQSFDEGLQLAVGYNIWQNNDFRMEGANGDFVKRWATLPYLFSQPAYLSQDDRFWKAAGAYETAYRFFFQLGNQPEMLLAQARAMIALLGVATGWLVFLWARELFGTAGGLISLSLFTFSPHMLAFGGIVSTDMSITLTLLASTWSIWRLLHVVTVWRVMASLLSFAVLVLAKPSGLVILPIVVLLVAIKLVFGRSMILGISRQRRELHSRYSQGGIIIAFVVAHAATGVAAIWAHYSFRYSASPLPYDSSVKLFEPNYRDEIPPVLRATIRWLRDHRIMPEGFHRGVHLLAGNDDETVSFLRGEWTVGGRPSFFPYAIWVKTSPPLFLIVLGGLVGWGWRRCLRRRQQSICDLPQWCTAPSVYAALPLITLIVCYLGVALIEELNIGHRHVLPIYPAIYVLAGSAGLLVVRRIWWSHAIAAILLAWTANEAFAIRPHYLAYFGPQAGGPENGFRHLVDSSIDWGMDLPELKIQLERRNPSHREPLHLAYFGTDSPEYHGLRATRLPGFFDRRPINTYSLEPGYYAISATILQSLYVGAVGSWSRAYENRYQIALGHMRRLEVAFAKKETWRALSKYGLNVDQWRQEIDVFDSLRCARLCAWLRNGRPPDFSAGYSILVWKLSPQDLHSALYEPPLELTDDPIPLRTYGRFVQLRR